MTTISSGVQVGPENPLVVFIHQVEGRLVDLSFLAFEVVSLGIEPAAAVQAEVALTNGPAGDRIGIGRYAARFRAPAEPGLYAIQWWWCSSEASPEQSVIQEFEVVPALVGWGARYAFVNDLREEGVQASVTDTRIARTVLLASAAVERITGRFFEPRYGAHRISGTEAQALLLGPPIIGIESVKIDSEFVADQNLNTELGALRVFNRHLSGLLDPDDRDSPKLEFVHSLDPFPLGRSPRLTSLSGVSLRSLGFPGGVQNVLVRGVFGYTEPDGSPFGRVPALIRHATMLLALRALTPVTDGSRDDVRNRWRITSERVRDQTITYAAPGVAGQWTGDPEIDGILALFRRPMSLGAA